LREKRRPGSNSGVESHDRDSLTRIHEKDYRDYEFISGEIERLLKLSPQELLNHLRDHPIEAFGGLNLPSGGQMFLSREAQRHFWQITERGLNLMGMASERHNPEKVCEGLKREFVTLIFDGFELASGNAHEVFSGTIRRIEAEHSTLTHHVPCSVVIHRARDVFTVGPVTFVLREKFLKQHETAIRACVQAWASEVRDFVLTQLTGFYTDFQWIASITVPPCDPGVSRRRAHEGIQRALDVFKLIVGSERARHVKQAYDFSVPQRHVNLISTVDGVFDISSGGTMHDAVVNDAWYEQVTSFPEWQLFEQLLFRWHQWGYLDELENRFFDALSWHADGVSDPDPGARIVKFWTGIERLLSVSAGSNLASRLAVLSVEPPADFARKSQEFSKLYQRRSEIIHGGAHRAKESWYREAALGTEEASKIALFQFLRAIPQIRCCYGSGGRKGLHAWLTWLDKIAKHHRRSLQQKT